jgi:ribosomal protein L37AE/L43A
MLDWFIVSLGMVVVTIVGFIVYAVRKTNAEIRRGMGPAPSERTMKRAIEEIRRRDVRCPRCGRQATAMLGTNNKYKCDTCYHEFEDVKHI